MKKIITLLLVLIMCFSVCSCSAVDKETIISEAQTTIENAFLKLNNNDIEEARKYMNLDAIETKLSSTLPEVDAYYGIDNFLSLWFPTVNCTVESSEFINENTVNFTVNITSASMQEYYAGYLSAYYQGLKSIQNDINSAMQGNYVEPSNTTMEEAANELISGGINYALDGNTCTNQVIVTAQYVDGLWQLKTSDELCNAILGDIDEATNVFKSVMSQ